jgi:hypothetical protein
MAKKMDNWPLYIAAALGITGVILGLKRGVVEVGRISTEAGTIAGLSWIIDNYGREYAEQIEKVLRWETAHFTSKQWLQGNTAGMEATSLNFPFGWSSLQEFVDNYGLNSGDFSTYTMVENNTGITKRFIKFPDVYTFIVFLAWFIKTKREGRIGYWYSLDENSATRYENSLQGVRSRFVDAIG